MFQMDQNRLGRPVMGVPVPLGWGARVAGVGLPRKAERRRRRRPLPGRVGPTRRGPSNVDAGANAGNRNGGVAGRGTT